MAHEPLGHPKLHGKAFLRDLLFSMGVILAIALWMAMDRSAIARRSEQGLGVP